MITYVINTSENNTFESDRFLGSATYNKIRWINCSLDQMQTCAETIYTRQNVLGADKFRVAIIIDFFGYDRIRIPYGRGKYGEEEGVDISLYMPYIQVYLEDHLVSVLEKRDLFAADYEIYYVQNSKYESHEFLDNAEEQLHSILSGNVEEGNGEEEFTSFTLYCTKNMSLVFKLSDYPYSYADKKMSFSEFFYSFKQRLINRSKIRCHYYIASCGSGLVNAALDTLSLSLYLIRVYEREETIEDVGYMEVPSIDGEALKDVLVTAWIKMDIARKMAAQSKRQKYFSLRQNEKEFIEQETDAEEDFKNGMIREIVNVRSEEKMNLSVDTMYWKIVEYDEKDDAVINAENRQEFDALFANYLRKRDETSETRIEVEFNELRKMGALVMTDQCPSRDQYEQMVKEKNKTISELFQHALNAEYIEMDYTEEREKSERAYQEYNKWRACTRKNIVADLIFMVLTMLVMLFPYERLQLGGLTSMKSRILYFAAAGVMIGAFLVSFIVNILIPIWRMRQQKSIIKECYVRALAKRRYSFASLKQRYEKDLVQIEEVRYEIRQLTHLYEANVAKERSVVNHRNMLEELQDRLGSMLNNLGVEPVYNPEITISEEFDVEKSFNTKDNSIYQIFSIEAIEKLFPKNRGENK